MNSPAEKTNTDPRMQYIYSTVTVHEHAPWYGEHPDIERFVIERFDCTYTVQTYH